MNTRAIFTSFVAVGLLWNAGCKDKSPTAPTTTVQSVRLTGSSTSLPVGGGDTEITATVTLSTGAPGGGISVAFTADRGTFNVGAVTTDAQGTAKVRFTTTATATVRGSASGVQGELRVDVKTPPTIEVRVDPGGGSADVQAGTAARFNISAKRGTANVAGRLTVTFGDGGSSTVDMDGTATVEHTYASSGAYNVSAQLVESDGTTTRETIRIDVKSRPGGDDIDARSVTYLHRNISDWAITSRITDVVITSSQICVEHTGAGRFPVSDFFDIQIEGNVWVFAKFGGQWYAGTYDWLRPGQTCKFVTGEEFGVDQVRIPPMDSSWPGPRSGEEVGFAVSSRARDSVEAGRERTNIKVIRWP